MPCSLGAITGLCHLEDVSSFPLVGWVPVRLMRGLTPEPGPLTVCCLPPAQCKRLEGGLDKLKEASIQLDELNQKLAEQKIVLAEKSAACETLLEEIATNTAIGECWGGLSALEPVYA